MNDSTISCLKFVFNPFLAIFTTKNTNNNNRRLIVTTISFNFIYMYFILQGR